MKRQIFSLLIFLLACNYGHTQAITPSVINSSGGNTTQGFYSIDWSVGELALVTMMQSGNNNLIVTNGFFQPNGSWANKSSVDSFTTNEVTILPNPTYRTIDVKFYTRQQGTISMIVYDVIGREVLRKKAVSFGTESVERVDLVSQPQGAYFLHIILEPAPGSVAKRKTYKIIKIQ